MIWWYWLVIGLMLLIGEIIVAGSFFLIFFGVAALIVGTLAGLGLVTTAWVQGLLFAILSIVLLLSFRKILRQKTTVDDHGVKMDSLVGETVVLIEDLAPQAHGKAELRGTTWNVHNRGATARKKGERCQVIQVEGLTLHIQ